MLIPDRKDLPRHVTNKLNEAQIQAYTNECFVTLEFYNRKYGSNYTLCDNSFGENVLFENGRPKMIFQPNLHKGILGFNVQKLFSINKICEVKNCDSDGFAVISEKKKNKLVCMRHYQMYLEKSFYGSYSEMFLSSEMLAMQDINGNYHSVALRNTNWETYEFIQVDTDDLEFVNNNRPFYKNRTVYVKYETIDGIKHTAKLYRVLLARALFGQYDHRLITSYLQVDHLDRNPLNNRIVNLRLCTSLENALNSKNYDKLKARGMCHGFGVCELAPNSYRITAYKLSEKSFPIPVEVKYFESLQIGLAWKYSVEKRLLQEIGVYDLLPPPITYKQSNPLPIKNVS